MNTVLDDGYTWLLDAIGYKGGSLVVRVVEGLRISGPEDFEVEGYVFRDTYAIGTTPESRRVSIRFDKLVAWQCVDESWPLYDDNEVHEGEGRLQVLTRSKYLDFVNGSYPLYLDIAGPAKHYRIWTEDEVIDAVALEPPTVESTIG